MKLKLKTVFNKTKFILLKHIDLRLNLYNLTNKYHFSQITGGHVILGAGRSILFSTGFHF